MTQKKNQYMTRPCDTMAQGKHTNKKQLIYDSHRGFAGMRTGDYGKEHPYNGTSGGKLRFLKSAIMGVRGKIWEIPANLVTNWQNGLELVDISCNHA